MIRRIAVIFAHELRILLRDRQALGLLFVMPLALIVFLTLAMQDVYQMKVGKRLELDIISRQVCNDPAKLCAELIGQLKRFPYQVKVIDDPAALAQGQLTLILPKDLEGAVERLRKGEQLPEAEQVQLVFDPSLDQSLRELVRAQLSLGLQAVLIAQVHRQLQQQLPKQGQDAKSPGGEAGALPDVSRFTGFVTESVLGGRSIPNPIQQTVPAWALFGMFFIAIPISSSMIRDRQLGIFKRLLSFPVSKSELLLGKVLPFFVICFLQFALMFAVGAWILPGLTHLELGLDFSFGALWAVTCVCAWAATSYGLMVSCLSRTQEQAAALGALSVVILAVLGGIMIPRFVMPAFMQSASQLSPLYWGLEAYHDVILRKAAFGVVGRKLGVLAGFSVVCGAVSLLRFRWSEV